MQEIKSKQAVSISEVKEILEKQDLEKMDQIQRWTYDYVTKFTKLDAKSAKKMKQELVKDCGITEEEAVEIVNIRPTTLAELRSFTFGWKKLILAETLEKMLKIIKEYS
ncbi:MAG: RNA polymerase Rpb4 [Nitrosopumilaceae archaeon]|jgi:DNA-directed RNA polymerase subunit F|nr:MAG: RNA polymerase Rpb4 [Nitrosopumilales archaeon]